MSAKPDAGLPLGAVPRVDLLPPEFKKAASDARTRGLLILLLILLIVVGLGATAGAYYLAEQENMKLESAQLEQTLLQGEISQYSDVPAVTGMVDKATQALEITTSGRLLWQQLFTSIQSVTPAGVRYTTAQADTGSPTEVFPGSGNLLSGTDVIGVIQVQAGSGGLVDIAAWQRELLRLPGVANAVIRQIAAEDGAGFTFDITVEFDSTRFQPIQIEEAE